MDLTVQKVVIHQTIVPLISGHAHREADKGSYEAVGFVARPRGDEIATATLQLHNHASNPQEAFVVEPWEQFRAERTLAKNSYEIIGVYHSHVNSEALPSQMDHKMAWGDGFFHFIYSVPYDDLKAYVKVDNWLEPAEIDVVTHTLL